MSNISGSNQEKVLDLNPTTLL